MDALVRTATARFVCPACTPGRGGLRPENRGEPPSMLLGITNIVRNQQWLLTRFCNWPRIRLGVSVVQFTETIRMDFVRFDPSLSKFLKDLQEAQQSPLVPGQQDPIRARGA